LLRHVAQLNGTSAVFSKEQDATKEWFVKGGLGLGMRPCEHVPRSELVQLR
jgi:hypothetical protein